MSKKVLVLVGSPRKNGNSDYLGEEFSKGAKDAGCEVEKIYVKDKSVAGCLGCGACQMNGGKCVQKDDMQEIYAKMLDADVIAIASPVYFYSWTSQIKAVIDRSFAIESIIKDTKFYLISCGAAPEEKYMENMTKSFELYVSCFKAGGNSFAGYVYGLSANKCGDVANTESSRKAYTMGLSV